MSNTNTTNESGIGMRGKITVPDVISVLSQSDGKLATQEQKVADYVKANLDSISTMTIAELAAECQVSTPTVIRFCRSLGCDGFREFKLRLAQNLAVSRQYLNANLISNGSESALDQVLGALHSSVDILRPQLDLEILDAAKTAIMNCRQLVVGGIGGGSSMLASEAANRLFRLGIATSSVNDSYVMQMMAATLRVEDVLLLFSASGEADAIVGAARIAGGYGATTISICKSGSSLAQSSDISITLDLPEDPDIFKPTASRYAYLAVLDVLAMSVAQAAPDNTKENLRRIRASLTAYHGRTGAQPLGD